MANPPTLVIAGCTATGKSAVAQCLAERIGAAIISADSMLVYRGMDVGTAKPSPAERKSVPYIGIDCVDPGERFSAGDWLKCVEAGIAALPQGTPLIVAGGTGLYIKALLEGLDAPPSDAAARAAVRAMFEDGGVAALKAEVARRGVEVPPGDVENPRRLMRALEKAMAGDLRVAQAISAGGDREQSNADDGNRGQTMAGASGVAQSGAIVGDSRNFLLEMDRDALAERIAARARRMFDEGIVEEALGIFGGGKASETAAGAIGYAEALAFAKGEMTLEAAIERTAARTRQLAKRQRTWFRHQFEAIPIGIAPADTPESIAARIDFEKAIT